MKRRLAMYVLGFVLLALAQGAGWVVLVQRGQLPPWRVLGLAVVGVYIAGLGIYVLWRAVRCR